MRSGGAVGSGSTRRPRAGPAVRARSPTGCAASRSRPAAAPRVPTDIGRTPAGTATTQAALGRALLDLTRSAPEAAQPGRHAVPGRELVDQPRRLGEQGRRLVGPGAARTGSPTTPRRSCTGGSGPTGQHLELGIAEANLVGLLGELGATWSRWGQPLLPIGVLYDPFVERALEPWSFGIYAGGQSILVGTPSGVTLAPEGGAHQSITTPSVGLEQPGCVSYEPAFAIDVEWTLLASLARLGRPDGTLGLPAAVDPAGRPDAGRGARPTRPPGSGAAARWSPAPTRCAGVEAPGGDHRGDGRGGAGGAGRRRAAGRARASPPTWSA